ncbi:integrin alpha-L isoform X2 [Ambystoma mexicanum]|uniref:integrin alpha-L isoform X2 n=1 Tax=Ambystoma mexicanum TaxID=8296 RepID=UPI0037E9B2AA
MGTSAYILDTESYNSENKMKHDTDNIHTPHLGLTLEDDLDGLRFIACAPGVPHECGKSIYLNGLCYVFENGFKTHQITPGYQECPKVDLVFLFDGSGSMNKDQFKSIINFMISVMDGLRNTTMQFAAVQFSETVQTEFNFSGFQKMKDPRKLLENITHLNSLTFTFKAIHHVITNVFNKASGHRPDAKKVMIIITDGEATDASMFYNPDPIETANNENIIRYIIGVGANFKGTTEEHLAIFASNPIMDHIKVLDSFDKLQTVFQEIQNKLFDIEGTSDANSFVMEMSSSGFSATLSPGLDVLGAVGAHGWAGGLIELRGENPTQENVISLASLSEDMKFAYLGYSVKRIWRRGEVLYATGAPRYRYVGKVVVLAANSTTEAWTIRQNILGTQIGSYFGSELCTVDLDGDNETDVLLIAAPLFHEDRRGGCVHVCPIIKNKISCHLVLRGEVGHPFARFGAAMSALKDLDGDGLADVAIGAPLENENTGAVYIFRGQKGSISSLHSQRISGSSGLKFFGQSLHGIMDLTGDQLTDIAVGARGQVLLFRSRPIVNISTSMTFQPHEILLKMFRCSGEPEIQTEAGCNITVCFNSSYVTSAYIGHLSSNLTYWLELDANRMKNRVTFQNGKRVITDTLQISEGQQCIMQSIFIPSCIEDYVSAIKVSVNFGLEKEANSSGTSAPSPILNPLYNSMWSDEIPFEKNCGDDGICKADLKVIFDASGDQQLTVKESSSLNVKLDLGNNGEDAYRTTLLLTYPAGLSYRKVSAIKTSVTCDMLGEQGAAIQATIHSLTCNIAHPIFKSGTQDVLSFLFDVLGNSSWGDVLDMNASVKSDYENGTLLDNQASLHIPILYAINVIGSGLEGSTKYVNFTVKKQEIKAVKHSYKVFTMDPNSLLHPVSFTVSVPINITTGLWWQVENVTTDPRVPCHIVAEEENQYLDITSMMNHSSKFKVFHCEIDQLNMTEVHLEGPMCLSKESYSSSQMSIKTLLWIQFNTSRYMSMYPEDFTIVQVSTQVEIIVPEDYFKIILGSSVGGLLLLLIITAILCKVGFFNRKYKEKMAGDCKGDMNGELTACKEDASEENAVQLPLNDEAKKE